MEEALRAAEDFRAHDPHHGLARGPEENKSTTFSREPIAAFQMVVAESGLMHHQLKPLEQPNPYTCISKSHRPCKNIELISQGGNEPEAAGMKLGENVFDSGTSCGHPL